MVGVKKNFLCPPNMICVDSVRFRIFLTKIFATIYFLFFEIVMAISLFRKLENFAKIFSSHL